MCNFVQYIQQYFVRYLFNRFLFNILCNISLVYSAILAMLATLKFYCALLHKVFSIVNNIGTSQFADVERLSATVTSRLSDGRAGLAAARTRGARRGSQIKMPSRALMGAHVAAKLKLGRSISETL